MACSSFQSLALVARFASLLALAGAGCQSTSGPAAASFASVTIANHTQAEITAAVRQVFGADGYQGGPIGLDQMVFEKPASRATSFAREGFVAGFYGAQTINRVRLEIVPLAGGTFRLQAKAYMVTGGRDPFFQDEVPLANVRSGPYQSLLDKVAKQLP